MVNTYDLAMMASTQQIVGKLTTGEQVITPENVPYILSVMMSDGMYNYSGRWTNLSDYQQKVVLVVELLQHLVNLLLQLFHKIR